MDPRGCQRINGVDPFKFGRMTMHGLVKALFVVVNKIHLGGWLLSLGTFEFVDFLIFSTLIGEFAWEIV